MGWRCLITRQQLGLLVGDDLSAAQRRSVERHVAGCPRCRDHLASLREARGLVMRLQDATTEPFPSLWSSIRPRLDRSRKARHSGRQVSLPIGVLVAASVAVAALVINGTTTYQYTDRHAGFDPGLRITAIDEDGLGEFEFLHPQLPVESEPADHTTRDALPAPSHFHLERARPVGLTPRDF